MIPGKGGVGAPVVSSLKSIPPPSRGLSEYPGSNPGFSLCVDFAHRSYGFFFAFAAVVKGKHIDLARRRRENFGYLSL